MKKEKEKNKVPKFEFKLINHHNILIPPERTRKDFGDIEGFARSILAAGGLKQNVVVEPSRSSTPEKFDLVAGERRYRALREILCANPLVWVGDNKPTPKLLAEWSQIPCKIEYNLTETERKLYELVENVDRKDFVWQERCLLFNEIHELCIQQHGKGTVGRGKTGWSLQDTANLVGKSKATLGEEIQMARQLKGDPLLGDIKRRSSAKIKMKRQAYEQVADFLEIGKQDAPKDMHLFCGKSEELLLNEKEFPFESFDLIITDPPWDIGLIDRLSHDRAQIYNQGRGQDTEEGSVDGIDPMTLLSILQRSFLCLRPNRGIYMFYSSFPDKIQEGFELLKLAGFLIEEIPLIWYKKNILSTSNITRHSLSYESILYGWKGDRPLLHESARNVYEFQVPFTGRFHSTQKPEGLIEQLLLTSTKEGESVLDPFAGSYSTARACQQLKRKCWAIDSNESFYKMAKLQFEGIKI
jgi:DNA modification methylase